MSALLAEIPVDVEPQLALVPEPAPVRAWDPIRFQMATPPPLRAADERAAEARHWAGQEEPLPSPSRWGASIVRTAAECLLGIRPAVQLVRWLDEPVYEALARRADLATRVRGARRGTGVTIRSAHSLRLDDHAAEVSVVLHDGERCRAAALRLECYHGRWLVTALEIG